MPYNRVQAERLLSATELPLFLDSLADRLALHSAAQLRALVKRARTQRDKARDLWQRQRVTTRSRSGSKGGRSGDANARTERKARLFDEVLRRFEKRLADLDGKLAAQSVRKPAAKTVAKAAAKPAAKLAPKLSLKSAVRAAAAKDKVGAGAAAAAAKTAKGGQSAPRSAKAPAKAPKPAAPAVGPTSEPARAKRHLSQLQQTGVKRAQAHLSSRGRRTQGKRDSRG